MPTWDIEATFNIPNDICLDEEPVDIVSTSADDEGNPYNLNNLEYIEVNGTILSNKTHTYTFTTPGDNIVRYKFTAPSIQDVPVLTGFFRYISYVDSVDVLNNELFIGDLCFSNCDVANISLPDNYSYDRFGDRAFAVSGLTSITLPSNIYYIGRSAFSICGNLQNIYLSQNHRNDIVIDDAAFSNCGFVNLNIPDGVETITDYAFGGCISLVNVTIPATATNISGYSFGNNSIEHITVSQNNQIYDSRNNCNAVMTTNTNWLIVGCKTTIIPSETEFIGPSAFLGCKGLTTINIPNGVTLIHNSAFYRCRDLTNITIPSSVTEIGSRAFFECDGLTSITVEAITPPTFRYTTIDFFDYTNDCPIYVPAESVNDYKTAWSKYESRIQAMPTYNPHISYNGITQDDYKPGSSSFNDVIMPTDPTTGDPDYSTASINSTNIYWNNAYLPSTGAYISYTYQLLWNLDYAITHGGDANVQANWNETDPTSYAYIQNKPTIPVVPTNVSAFNNDAQYATTSDIPVVPTNVSAFNNDAQYAYSSDIPVVPTNVSAFNNDAQYAYSSEIENKANASDAVGSLQLAFDTSTYTITLSGRRVDGTPFTVSDTVDLPLETMIVNGVYNTQSKSIIFTKQDGSTLTVNLSSLIDGLQEEITRNNKLDGSLIEDDSITLDQLAEDVTSELDKASTSIQGVKVNGELITPDENNIVNIIVETPTPSGYFLTLNGVKKHLNIDYAFTDDDDYLNGLIDVAQTMVARHLDYSSVDALLEKYDNDIPSPIIHACYLLIGNYYMNRESVSPTNMTPIPQSYEYLLAMYKNRTNYQG